MRERYGLAILFDSAAHVCIAIQIGMHRIIQHRIILQVTMIQKYRVTHAPMSAFFFLQCQK